MAKYSYTVKLPKDLYDWTFNHTGPPNIELKYVTDEDEDRKKKAYFLLKKKPK